MDSKNAKALKSPVQKRSRATLDRIFSATTKLLTKKRYSDISIAEIAKEAKCGVGTVYGRFENKEALLASIEERTVQGIVDRMESFARSKDWSDVSFDQRVRALVGHIADSYRVHGPVLRELVSMVHQSTAGASDDSRAKMTMTFQRDIDFLLEGIEKVNKKKARKILGIALMSVIVTLQNRMLQFQTSPIEQEFSEKFLEAELSKMVIAYVQSVL